MSGLLTNPALLVPGVAAPVGAPVPASPPTATTTAAGFADVLRQTADVRFSAHALERLRRRGIDVDGTTLQRLTNGVDRAASKGSRESVVFVDGTAFVVGVRNRTVITAVDDASMRQHVFTNIDSAVIA